MVQIYFLLILSNLLMGLVLAKDFLNTKIENFNNMDQILSDEILQVTIGCIGTVVGFLALFLRYSGNIIILGDLIPATIAIVSGITLFVKYIDNEESSSSVIIIYIKKVFLNNKTILGFISFFVGVIHFIAPSVNLL